MCLYTFLHHAKPAQNSIPKHLGLEGKQSESLTLSNYFAPKTSFKSGFPASLKRHTLHVTKTTNEGQHMLVQFLEAD